MKKLTPFITAAIFTIPMSCIGNAYAEWKELGSNAVMAGVFNVVCQKR